MRLASPEVAPSDPRAPDDAPAERAADLALRARPHDSRFAGPRARIRGYVDTADATPFPAVWRLRLEPSTVMPGPERADPRLLEFESGEQEFVLEDVPLGGYDLIAEAPGLNGERCPVLLDRRNADPYVTLLLHPAGYVAGRVVDATGLVAEGVPVTLRGPGQESERSTVTDPLGRYRFDGVLDGDHELWIGPRERPLLPPSSLRFKAPSMTVPDRTLPELSALAVLVLDEDDRPVPEARVRGSGSEGGVVDVVTDVLGRAEARYLPPGRYRLSAEHELYPRARLGVDLAAEPGDVVLRFGPAR